MNDEMRNLLLHPSDRKALNALTSIPAFTPILKAFLKVFNEQQMKIINMSSKVRITPEQLPEIYNLLPPICEKLGIEEPELYLELDRSPNAYTTGDTVTSITVTTGLLEYMSLDEISTVLAHECGHIACHHVLYHTMAQMILAGVDTFVDVSGLITIGLKSALQYWVRCSELSADRASALCSGGSKPVVDVMLRLAGGGKDLPVSINPELFMQQAIDYEDMIEKSVLNKYMESLLLSNMTHPLLTIRSLEVTRWCKSPEFRYLVEGRLPAVSTPVDGAIADHSSGTVPISNGAQQYNQYAIQQNNSYQAPPPLQKQSVGERLGSVSDSLFSSFKGAKKDCVCPACKSRVSSQDSFCKTCGYKFR